jgi:hypothetical protein
MPEKPGPQDVVVWSVGRRSPEVEVFELRTRASGLIERIEGTWTSAIERAKVFAERRQADVWKQDRTSYHRVWTFGQSR